MMRTATIALLAASSACIPPQPKAYEAPGPHVWSVTPETVLIERGAAASVSLSGAGFTSSNNIVDVGPVRLIGLPASSDGRTIRLTIPDAVRSGNEAPPADWTTGRYPIVVTNQFGRSDTAWITIQSKRSGIP